MRRRRVDGTAFVLYNTPMKKMQLFQRFFIYLLSAAVVCPLLSGCAASDSKPYTETQYLLDTVCTIEAGGDTAEDAVKEAFSAIASLQHRTDRFSDTSVVTEINRAPAGVPIPLDDDLYTILDTALAVAEASGGAFDITVAPAAALWDFKSETPEVPDADALAQAAARVDYRSLTLDREAQTVTKRADDTEIDLGGAAKGYAADLAHRILAEADVTYGIIDLGGNIYVFGQNPRTADGRFSIGIQTPFAENGTYDRVETVDEGAVVTSGCYQRYFEKDGVLYHHILDPATGYPVQNGVASVSVTADAALLADCLSTACFVLGQGAGDALAERFGAKTIWVMQDTVPPSE